MPVSSEPQKLKKEHVPVSVCVSVIWMRGFENMGKERSSFSVGMFPFSLLKQFFKFDCLFSQ